MTAKQLLDSYKQQLVESVCKCVSFKTVRSNPEPNAPFGKEVANCLDFVLSLCEKNGLKTYNCDYYAGHADFGGGEEILGILGHLDVVPVTDGWKAPPFEGRILDNVIYGRGTVDNKGPMIACLYAVKALKESGFVPNKKIRLIFGCDEESGMACMEYYLPKVKTPQVAFSPDGDFPVINAEKGIYQIEASFGKLPKEIEQLRAGDRVNVVPDLCEAAVHGVKVPESLAVKYNAKISTDGNRTLITTTGKSTHGSTPQYGLNATWNMFRLLSELFPDDKTLKFAATKLSLDFNGTAWGFPLKDEASGNMTVNIGKVRLEQGLLCLAVDIRFPVAFVVAQVETLLKENSPAEMKITKCRAIDPLYVEKDNKLVQTLLNSYERVTGQKGYTIAIGGGTYSRQLPTCVAFGPVFPDDEKTIHEINERVSIDKLMAMAHIYMDAITELSK